MAPLPPVESPTVMAIWRAREAEAAAEAAAAAARPPVDPTAAELKAARDARYAARKARQGK